MFLFVFIIVALIIIPVFHSYRKKGGDFLVDLTLGSRKTHIVTQMTQYVYLFVILCEIGLCFEIFIGEKSLLRYLGGLPEILLLINDVPAWLGVGFYYASGAMAGISVLLFFVLPHRFISMFQLLITPFLFYLAQYFIHPFGFYELVFESLTVYMMSLSITSALFFMIIVMRIFSKKKVHAEALKLIKKKPGIIVFIFVILIIPSCVYALWLFVSYAIYLFAKTSQIWHFVFIVLVPVLFNVVNITRILLKRLLRLYDKLYAYGKKR